ncbi:MAG: TIGR01777 family oxidoreductase [Pyrinomonadaceae bacterium]
MKIVLPGGTGQIGSLLARSFQTDGHEVVVLSRDPKVEPWPTIAWDAETLGDWTNEIDGADVVINLAGRNVNCRYTPGNQRLIMDSRVNSARVVGEAINRSVHPPKVWLQMSTATIYSHRFDAANNEHTGIIGGNELDAPAKWGFSIQVAQNWEKAQTDANTPDTRKVQLRTAVVMNPDPGSPFDFLTSLVRYRLGGKSGDGRQYISWIHDRDFVRAVNWLIDDESLTGPVILAAPDPRPNAEFMRDLRAAYGVKLGLPAAKFMLTLGAWFMSSETELILKSRRVVPTRLLESGFTFAFPDWPDAARDLCKRWRDAN